MPHRPHANRGGSFTTLFDESPTDGPARGGDLPPNLRRYGERLSVTLHPDRPSVIVNFVESLDGVVTFDPEHGSGGEISGFSEPDRFVMGLLRALADVIVVGAGTVRSSPGHAWTPGQANRTFATGYAAWRRELGLAEEPTTIVVSASGDVPTEHRAFASVAVPVIVATTAAGAQRLHGRLPAHVRIVDTHAGDHVTAGSVVTLAAAEGARLILSEGGPHLNGTFVAEGLVDELFLTLAPQLLGRAGPGDGRFGLVEGVSRSVDDAPWARLLSVRRSLDHLFLRYAFAAEG